MPTPFTRDQLSPQMQQRYGLDRRPVGRWVAIGALVLAFVATLSYIGFTITSSPIDARLVTWESTAPDRTDITISVLRPEGAEVTCVLRAQDANRIDVGYATVVIPPGEGSLLLDYRLRTLAPARTAELLGCAAGSIPDVTPPQFPPGVVPPEQPWS